MPTRYHRIRILLVALPILMGLVALGYRLYQLQVVRHLELTQAVNRMHERRIKLPASRGAIMDRNRNILAHSVPVCTVVADPQAIQKEATRRIKAKQSPQTQELVSILSESLNLQKSEVQQKLGGSERYVILKKKVSKEVVQKVQDIFKQQRMTAALGVRFEDDQTRLYPNGSLMSHVVGYVNAEQRGVDGVEYLMQQDLQGEGGWQKTEHDNKGREIVPYRKEDFAPRNGYSVILTLDQAIQNMVEQELDRAIEKHRPDSAVVIVMRPSTGEILALASRPTFDPNAKDKKIDTLRNRAIADLNEPGSTFKIVTVATALDHRVVDLDDTIFCENGKFFYGGKYLNDHEPLGNLSVAGVLIHSSNIGVAKIALMLGNERMHQAMKNFGFGEKAFGTEDFERWPGEVSGIVHSLRKWTKVSITHVAMGHEVAVTPLQMANAMCALANGGNLMRPLVIKQVINQEGQVVREFFPQVRRRVVDQKAARLITEALKQVVSKEGTAARAAIPGFVVAGKTGTAWKVINGQYYDKEQVIASFSGYFPAENPELCIYVMLDNPKGKDTYGGAVAAPVFHDIAIRAASYINLRPSVERSSVVKTDESVVRVANREVIR